MSSKFCLLAKKTFAFTLAETLIVIGIIGIVSALTLPNLNSSTSDKEKLSKFKKVRQNIEDALGRAEAVYGPVDEWYVNDGNNNSAKQKRLSERLTEFMKIQKTCPPSGGECFHNASVLNLKGTNIMSGSVPKYYSAQEGLNSYTYLLSDGTAIMFVPNNNNKEIMAWFDIDGPSKGKNTIGSDIFAILYENSNINFGMDIGKIVDAAIACRNASNPKETVLFCTLWIAMTDNMEYLKANDDGVCPNGNILDGTTNTTCK